MTRRRIALIGLGMAVTPHAKSLIDLKGRAEVVWATSRSEKRCANFAARFPFPVTADIDAIIADNSISAVGLLTPPNSHLELVERLARSGKHVLIEKPLDITTARSEALVDAGEKARVKIAVCLQHRFKPAAERLAAILAAQELGKSSTARHAFRCGGRRPITTNPDAAPRRATAAASSSPRAFTRWI